MRAATSIHTRSLTLDDADAVTGLAVRLGGHENAADRSSLLSRLDRGAIAVAAEAGGRLVGYAAGEVRAGFGLGPAGWVEAFAVDLEWRGHGVGRALATELLRRFQEAGAARVYTLVPLHDRSLGPFFRQLGFRDEPLACLGRAL